VEELDINYEEEEEEVPAADPVAENTNV